MITEQVMTYSEANVFDVLVPLVLAPILGCLLGHILVSEARRFAGWLRRA